MSEIVNEGMTIDEATPDTDVSGSELLPISDGGVPKHMSVEQVKDFVIAKLSSLPTGAEVDLDGDDIIVIRNGVSKSVTAKSIADETMAYLSGKGAVSSIGVNDKICVSVGSDSRTVTMGQILEWVKSEFVIDAFNIEGLSPVSHPLEGSDCIAISQFSETGTFKTALTSVFNFFKGLIFPSATTSTSAIGDNDYLLVGRVNEDVITVGKVKLSDAGLGTGNVSVEAPTTDSKVPQWDGSNGKLKDGLFVVGAGSSDPITSSSSDNEIPTAAAVYQHCEEKVDGLGDVSYDGNDTGIAVNGSIPRFSTADGKKIRAAYSVQNAITNSETAIPTCKAVKTKLDNFIQDNYVVRAPSGFWPTNRILTCSNTGYEVNVIYDVQVETFNPVVNNGIPTSKVIKDWAGGDGNGIRASSLNYSFSDTMPSVSGYEIGDACIWMKGITGAQGYDVNLLICGLAQSGSLVKKWYKVSLTAVES